MKRIILSLLLVLVGYCARAQSDYLITTKADTIHGEVRILTYDQLDRAQISNNGKKETYTALQILMLNKDNEVYKPVKNYNTINFMKVIKAGYLTLYGFRLPNQSTYDGRFLAKLDGSFMEMPNLSFKKMMAGLLADCSELSEKIKKGEIGKRDIEEIVEQYNLCLSKENPVVVQESVAPAESQSNTSQLEAIQSLINKVNDQDFSSRKDALDILRDMESKVNRNENIANYLIEGLQSLLKDQPSLSEDLEKLVTSFKK